MDSMLTGGFVIVFPVVWQTWNLSSVKPRLEFTCYIDDVAWGLGTERTENCSHVSAPTAGWKELLQCPNCSIIVMRSGSVRHSW